MLRGYSFGGWSNLSGSSTSAAPYLASYTNTRQFLCLSAAVILGETSGFDEPAPVGVRGNFIPLALSAAHTVLARARESS